MKVLRIVRFLVFAGLFTTKADAQKYRIFINPSSKVTVHGSTNVNQFRFKYTELISIEKPVTASTQNKVIRLTDCTLYLKINAFDSGNPMMNKDFRKMLNEAENPFIQVNLITLMPLWELDGSWRKGKVELLVEMNGIAKKFIFDCSLEDPGSLLIFGRQRFSITDFDLTPPSRMMGMVKVSEWVDFDFELRFGTDG